MGAECTLLRKGGSPSPFCWSSIEKGTSPAPSSSACAHLLTGPLKSERMRATLKPPSNGCRTDRRQSSRAACDLALGSKGRPWSSPRARPPRAVALARNVVTEP